MPGTHSSPVVRRRLLPLLDLVLVVGGLLVLLTTPRFVGTDGSERLATVRALADGRVPETTFSLVMPVLALPLHGAARLRGMDPEALLYVFNVLALAVLVAWLWSLLRPLDGDLARRLVLLLVFATMLPAHVNGFYGEVLTAALVLGGLGAVVLAPSAPGRLLGWGLVVLGVVNTPATLPALGLVVLVLVVRTRRAWPLLVLVAAVVLVAVDLWLRFGALTSPYPDTAGARTVLPYSGLPGFSYPFFFGLLGILLSFGKGLVFFAPGLFLPVRRRLVAAWPRLATLHLLGVAVVVGLVLVYSTWWSWYGGYYWGPRFFLLASLVAALVLAVRLSTPEASTAGAAVTLLALTLSSWVGAAAVLGNVGQGFCQDNGYALEFLCWYSPEFSVLWQPFISWPDTTLSQELFLGLVAIVWLRLALPLVLVVIRGVRVELPRLLAPEPVEQR